jgi:hypothetical protein
MSDAEGEDRLARLLIYAKANGRVCPVPQRWSELWESLPKRRRVCAGEGPPLPLILAAWWESTADEKRRRLELHLNYAAEHGVLDKVEQFLLSLAQDEWAYGDGT